MELKNFFYGKEIPFVDLGEGVKRRVLSHYENLMYVEVCFEKGSAGALHSHPHEQMTYVLEGVFEFNLAGEKKVVKSGDSIYFEPNILHETMCLEKGKLLDVFSPHREDFL